LAGCGSATATAKGYEWNTVSSEAMIYITMIHVMLRRLAQAQT